MDAIRSMMMRENGYPNAQFSSGILKGETVGLKFIPYIPAIKVNGMNMDAKMVSTFMTSFILLLTLDM